MACQKLGSPNFLLIKELQLTQIDEILVAVDLTHNLGEVNLVVENPVANPARMLDADVPPDELVFQVNPARLLHLQQVVQTVEHLAAEMLHLDEQTRKKLSPKTQIHMRDAIRHFHTFVLPKQRKVVKKLKFKELTYVFHNRKEKLLQSVLIRI